MRNFIFLCFFIFSLAYSINLDSIFTYTFNPNKNYNYESAKKLYFDKKCYQCHGDNGEKKIGNSRIIKDMTPQQLKSALIDFTLNPENGSSGSRIQMAEYARSLSHNEMDDIIAYLKGSDFAIDLQIDNLKKEEPKQKTQYGTFIK